MALVRNRNYLAGAALAALMAICANPAAAQSVAFQGSTFVNKGLVGVARIPSNARDKAGETLGGLGSALDFEPCS